MMSDRPPPKNASLEFLLEWLRRQRAAKPSASLASLLAGTELDASTLLELACVDLMQRRRAGHPVRAEDYAESFPALQSDERLLDLIDAEICIAVERGQPIDRADYLHRFPQLAAPIQELLGLEAPAVAASRQQPLTDEAPEGRSDEQVPDNASREAPTQARAAGHPSELEQTALESGLSLDPSASFSVELAVREEVEGDTEPSDALPLAGDHPLNAPQWFSAEKCLASGPGRWLIRGRDSLRGTVMAMKVLQLPADLSEPQFRQILDACEAASKVRHPIWVAPTVAAIQQRHLGVIRPWVFAVPWESAQPQREIASQLRQFASLAFCLEAAHRAGAAHGAVQSGNLLVDHDGKLRLVDAVANREGLQRWFDQPDNDSTAPSILPLSLRQRIDLQDLLRLVESACDRWNPSWSASLMRELKAISETQVEGAGEVLGSKLMQCADSPAAASQAAGSSSASDHGGERQPVGWKRWFGSSRS